MGKIIITPEAIPKEIIPREGVTAVIKSARIARNVYTSIGQMRLGLGITVDINGKEYSAIFSLDKEVITGSAARLLVLAGISAVGDDIEDKHVQGLVGKKVRIVNKGGKLYWYT